VEKVRNFVTTEITEIIANSTTRDDEERVMVSQEPSSSETTCSDSESSIWNSLDQVYAKRAPSINPRARAIMEVQRYVEDELLNRKNDPLEFSTKQISKNILLLSRHFCTLRKNIFQRGEYFKRSLNSFKFQQS
jgi:hypothetical protein